MPEARAITPARTSNARTSTGTSTGSYAIRAEERRSGHHIPIIAMTAHAMAGDRQRCLEAGMDEYISKPIQVDIVFETIARVSAATRLT